MFMASPTVKSCCEYRGSTAYHYSQHCGTPSKDAALSDLEGGIGGRFESGCWTVYRRLGCRVGYCCCFGFAMSSTETAGWLIICCGHNFKSWHFRDCSHSSDEDLSALLDCCDCHHRSFYGNLVGRMAMCEELVD